jgi:uncharacterized protein YbjT (DUF2867 family)
VKVIVYGASGMVGQGVLRECVLDPDVTEILTVGRRPLGRTHAKLTDKVVADLADLSTLDFTGYDACFFCLGVSSAGMSEERYRRITYDFTLAAGRKLAVESPGAAFTYVSGMGTDEHGRQMWARVKGKTESDLLDLPLKAYMFRPGYIQPKHGATSRTTLYRVLYVGLAWLYPLIRRVAPKWVTTTEQIGRAMLHVARQGSEKKILDPPDMNAL